MATFVGISASGVFVGRASNSWTELGSVSVDLAINQAHHVKAEVVDTVLSVFVDDMSHALVSVTDGTYTSGMNGVRVFGTDATFDTCPGYHKQDIFCDSNSRSCPRKRSGTVNHPRICQIPGRQGIHGRITDPIEKTTTTNSSRVGYR
jgi:nitrous oxide reductase